MSKVYVSSTYLDLQECRDRVRLILRRLGHDDVSMEYYIAGESRPVEECLLAVESCDLFIGLFAWRYGYVPEDANPEKLSINEMEYQLALKSGKSCLIFLLSEEAPWPRKFMDRDARRIEQLRAELSARHLVGFFTSAQDIDEAVYPAVVKWSEGAGQTRARLSVAELDLTAYYAALSRRYQHLDLDALTPPQRDENLRQRLREIFVEQSVRENPPPVELPKEVWEKLQQDREIQSDDLPLGVTPEDVLRARESYFEKPPQPVLEVIADSGHQHIVLLGDPGSGKSTIARYLLLSLISGVGDGRLDGALEGYLPLLIELRSYVGFSGYGRSNSFLDFIDHLSNSEGWGLNKGALDYYLKVDGRAVVIFDGLDEIFDPEERESVAQRIAGFAGLYPKARVVVTSRVIGYRRKALTDAEFSHFTLQDLDERQVEQFIDRWYALALDERPEEARARRERIMRSIKDSPSIRQLAGNPMLLTIMAIIGKNQELPRERWKLYDHAASVLIHHWDVERHLRDRHLDAPFIGEEEKKELLRRLAFKMQSGEGGLAGNYIHRDALQREFESYLRDRFAQPPAAATTVARAMIDQFRERNFILSLHGANLYGFVNRAFLEFFCASAFARKFTFTGELTLEELKQDVFGAHCDERSWHEVLRLICGMVDDRFAGELINYLTNEVTELWRIDFDIHPPLNIGLAIQCLAEVRNMNSVAETAEHLLKVVCRLFETQMKNSSEFSGFIKNQISKPAKDIGRDWPRRELLERWVEHLQVSQYSWAYAWPFGEFVGSVGMGSAIIHNSILKYAAHSSPSYRVLAPFALSEGWPNDPRTLPIIKASALNDADESVRVAALSALGEYYRNDAQTIELFRELASTGEIWTVRRIAVDILGKYFRDDERTHSLLTYVYAHDADHNIRGDVVQIIGEYFQHHPNTLPAIHRAIQDENAYVRNIAVRQLGKHFKDDKRTVSLLRECVLGDASADVRRGAIEQLSLVSKDDRRVFPLLREVMLNDPDKGVRLTTLSILVRLFPDDESTLELLRELAKDEGDLHEEIRLLAIKEIGRAWPFRPGNLLLLDSLADSSLKAVRRQAAITSLNVRKRRVKSWQDWLAGMTPEEHFGELPSPDKRFPLITVRSVRLRNIRAFANLDLRLSRGDKSANPLILLLGDNAAGKSTVLRCIALAMLGSELANQVEKRPESYLRHTAERGIIEVLFQFQLDSVDAPQARGVFCVGLEIRAGENSFRDADNPDLTLGRRNAVVRLNWLRRRTDDRFGFLCAYGALRGLADDSSALITEEPKETIDRVISLFRPNAPLIDPDVLGKMIRGDLSNFRTAPKAELDSDVCRKMAELLELLLPGIGWRGLQHSSEVKLFDTPVPLRDLSDGYGSFLALIGHTLRHGLAALDWKADPTGVSGILMIDEVDVHLHPAWQREVMRDLQKVFPRLQIIGSSHSPMVAGSVATDSIVVLRRDEQGVRNFSGQEMPSVMGWRADQILTSLLFALPTTRSIQTEEIFQKYATLLNERGPESPEVKALGSLVSKAMGFEGEGTIDTYTHKLLDEILLERFKSLDDQTRKLVLAKAGLMLAGKESRHDQN